MIASNVFSASSLSMLNGGRIVKITLWPVCFSNSVAMAFAAICVDPTLSTRTSAVVARVGATMSINVLTAIVRKDGRMMSSRNAAVVIARESTPEGGYPLFDHLVGAGEQHWRHIETERLGGAEIDHQLELGRLLHRQISGLRAFENPSGVNAGETMGFRNAGAITRQSSCHGEFP